MAGRIQKIVLSILCGASLGLAGLSQSACPVYGPPEDPEEGRGDEVQEEEENEDVDVYGPPTP